jgi:hypothetical protein
MGIDDVLRKPTEMALIPGAFIDRPPSESAFVEDAAIVGGQRNDATLSP